MARTVRTNEELAKAVKEDASTIIVEGDLKNKVLRIKATGKVTWGIAIGAIAVAVIAILAAPASGGTSAAVGVAAAPAAAAILGGSTTVAAISIAVAAGSVDVLNNLRDYRIAEETNSHVVLKK